MLPLLQLQLALRIAVLLLLCIRWPGVAAATLFCGSGASGKASAANSTVCVTMGRMSRVCAGCVSCVCACIDTAKERARTTTMAAINLGEKSGLT